MAPKIKYCLTIDANGIIQKHKTFKGFNDKKRLLDQSQYFNMLKGIKISAMLRKISKKSFNSGIIIPMKKRLCNECKDKRMCNRCNTKNNENKEFETNLNL